MTVTDQIKILDKKIKQNDSQCDLDREAAKISALSSNNLEKYELSTGEDLGLKPSTVEQAKFEYSPLGKIFNKGLSEDEKKEGLFKRLENIKDKSKELINRFTATNKASKNKTNNQSNKLIYNANLNFTELENIDNIKKLSLNSMFNLMKEYHKKFNKLNNLKPRTKDNKNKRLEVLIHVSDIYNELYYIFKSKYNKKIDKLSAKNNKKLDYKQLKFSDVYQYSSEEEQEEKQKPTKDDAIPLSNIIYEETNINEEVFKKYFNFQRPSDMLMLLNTTEDKTKKQCISKSD